MGLDLTYYTAILRCPVDQGPLTIHAATAVCTQCRAAYARHATTLLDLLPAEPIPRTGSSAVERANILRYETKFREPFRWMSSPRPWGAMADLPPREVRRVIHQQDLIRHALPSALGDFCDISVGSGRHAIPLLPRARHSVLCEVSVDDLNFVHSVVQDRDNVLMVRCDYLRPPFAPESFDTLLCTDTLIYGLDHEARLLSVLHAMLRPGGRLLGDFKCAWHTNPLRGPYMVSYTWTEVRRLLERAGFRSFQRVDYFQECTWLPLALAKYLLPPTRYFVMAEK